MTSQQQLVCDSSTLANFKQWASAISAFFSTAGWSQSSDTGQVNWGTISSVPGSGAYVYEVWEPNDGLTNFYLKVEYGNFTGSANSPALRFTIGTTTNGAGTMTGEVMGPYITIGEAFTPASTTAQYECDFSGAAGRMQVIMWRNATAAFNQAFSIERSNTNGTYDGRHVTLITVGVSTIGITGCCVNQQSLLFGTGVAPASSVNGNTGTTGGLGARLLNPGNTTATSAFNNEIPFDTVAPAVGMFDYNLTGVGIAASIDIAEGVPFSVTLYSATRTYMPSKLFSFSNCGPRGATCALCMRYD